MKVAFYTLGCKVNQYETQAMEQMMTARGHQLVPFEGEADAYVINTCSVTAVSDKKSRQMIRRARKAAPDAILAVCGCYAQTHPEDMADLSIDLVAGTGDRAGFADLLEQTWRERQPVTALDNAMSRRHFEVLPAGGLEGRTRAMLKVEDGCVNFCTYCIIPYARGPIRSLPLEEAKVQVAQLAAEGARPDVIVVDPPRKGCDEATLTAIAAMAPRTVVMVSCNAATAARDTRWLVEHGYKAEEVQPVDLFPRTKHVECVVKLVKEV